MTETTEQLAIQKVPLDLIHARLSATMTEREGWSVPASYGDELFEYAAVRESGVGVSDLSSRGRLLVSGSEAVPFLNGLISNDMKTLEPNHWMPAVFPNVQGRLLASVRVIRIDNDFLIDTEPVTHDTVAKTLERFTLAGDFHVADLTRKTALLSLQGKEAADVIAEVLNEPSASLSANQALRVQWSNREVTVVHASHTSEDGFDLFVNSADAETLWDAITNARSRPVGFAALERLRIEAGVPRYGVDMNEDTVVTETNLDDAVSYTKGCYIGQEIIARIKYRGHIAKKLTGLNLNQPGKIAHEAKIRSLDDKEIGRLTSVTYSPHLGQTIALAFVKYDYLAAGTGVKVISLDHEHLAQVTELPFVRGRW